MFNLGTFYFTLLFQGRVEVSVICIEIKILLIKSYSSNSANVYDFCFKSDKLGLFVSHDEPATLNMADMLDVSFLPGLRSQCGEGLCYEDHVTEHTRK